MKKIKFATAILFAMLLAVALVMPAAANNGLVDPPEVSGDIETGASMTIEKLVTTPPIPPNPDIYFMADTTGSMGGVIAAVQANASAILAAIVAAQPSAQFGVGNYRDFPYDPYCFQHQLPITANTAAVSAAIGAWTASGGADGPEGQFYALTRLADPLDPEGIGWRGGPNKIVVWFGDAPAHDPVPNAATLLGYDIDETSVITDLQAAGIKVIAISINTGYYESGTDDDPLDAGGDYIAAYGIVEDGAAGQASRIAADTDGVYMFAATPEAAAAAVIELIEGLTTDVWWEVSSDVGLTVELSPVVYEDVPGDTTVPFIETISVDIDAIPCTHLYATVEFYANEYPEEGDIIGTQQIDIHVIAVPVDIDIKPGSYPNSINLKNKGVVPVALLGSETFDVAMVDAGTLMFAPAGSDWGDGTTPVHTDVHYEDVNMDGYVDLVSHYSTGDIGLSSTDTEACLRGRFLDGRAFEGCDSVRILHGAP